MVKGSGAASTRGKHKHSMLKAAQEKGGTEASQRRDVQPSKKLQHKITKRVGFLERVAQSSLAAKSGIKKQRKRKRTGQSLRNLSSLAKALGVVEQEAAAKKERRQKGLSVGGAKKRKQINAQETVRLQQVLANADFKRDPLAAVAVHLDATLPPVDKAAKAEAASQRRNINGSHRQKLRRIRALTANETESTDP